MTSKRSTSFAGMFSGSASNAKTIFSTVASVSAAVMVFRSLTRELIPRELQNTVYSTISDYVRSFSPEITLIIPEHTGNRTNQIYRAAETYVGERIAPKTTVFLVAMVEKDSQVTTRMAKNQEVEDVFNGATFKWQKITRKSESQIHRRLGLSSGEESDVRCFQLRFHKKHKDMVFESYFPHILTESKNLNQMRKSIKICASRSSGDNHIWYSIKLDHPATFDTLALDPELKKVIMDDLDRFVSRRDYYKEIGKIWKRGYLLYGPPGTGKSSLIAAMANHLNFDIFDLELSDVRSNSDLRRLLIGTTNRSILVVEDIDCSIDLEDRKGDEKASKAPKSSSKSAQTINIKNDKPKTVTLSGLLNFIDGLWSSCGDERIIVVTTNHKEHLDPALLRPGRMDMHIHLSYCTPSAFKILAGNYLNITHHHHLFDDIGALLEEVQVTPAEVGEQLLRNEDADAALSDLVEFLLRKKKEKEDREEEEAKKAEEKKKDGENGEIQND